MTALTAPRQTRALDLPRVWRTFPVKEAAVIFAGAMVGIDAAGDLTTADASSKVLGVAQLGADNTDGGDGDLETEVDTGIAHFENSAGGDELTAAHVGDDCYAVDDQTVALGSGGTAQVTDATLTFNGTDVTGLIIAGKLVTVTCDTDADTTVTTFFDALEASELAADFTFADMTTKVRITKKTGGTFSIAPYKPATATFVIAEVTPGVAPDRPRAGKVHEVDSAGVWVDFR